MSRPETWASVRSTVPDTLVEQRYPVASYMSAKGTRVIGDRLANIGVIALIRRLSMADGSPISPQASSRLRTVSRILADKRHASIVARVQTDGLRLRVTGGLDAARPTTHADWTSPVNELGVDWSVSRVSIDRESLDDHRDGFLAWAGCVTCGGSATAADKWLPDRMSVVSERDWAFASWLDARAEGMAMPSRVHPDGMPAVRDALVDRMRSILDGLGDGQVRVRLPTGIVRPATIAIAIGIVLDVVSHKLVCASSNAPELSASVCWFGCRRACERRLRCRSPVDGRRWRVA